MGILGIRRPRSSKNKKEIKEKIVSFIAVLAAVIEVGNEACELVFNILDIKTPIEIETSLGKKKTNDIVKIQFKDREENEYVKFMYLVENYKKNESHYDVYRGITEYNLTYEFSNTNNCGIVYDEGVFSNGSREVFSDGAVGSVSVFDDYNKTLDEVKEVEQNGYKEHKVEEHQEYNYSNATKDYLNSFNYYMNILGDNISEEDYSNSIDYLEQNGFFDSLGNSADILNSVYGEYGSYFGFVEEETESHSR